MMRISDLVTREEHDSESERVKERASVDFQLAPLKSRREIDDLQLVELGREHRAQDRRVLDVSSRHVCSNSRINPEEDAIRSSIHS
jgi:hypothetical protein